MRVVFGRAMKATFITSFTTAAAFVANMVSPIPALRVFGIFMFMIVAMNFFMVITIWPAVLVIYETRINGKFTCFGLGPACGRVRSRIVGSLGFETPNIGIEDHASVKYAKLSEEIEPPESGVIPSAEDDLAPSLTTNITVRRAVERPIEQFFGNKLAPLIFKGRWLIVGILAAIFIASIVLSTRLQPSKRPPAFFPEDHNVQRFLDWQQSGTLTGSTLPAGATKLLGCDGVLGSGKKLDDCGVCGGDGRSCAVPVAPPAARWPPVSPPVRSPVSQSAPSRAPVPNPVPPPVRPPAKAPVASPLPPPPTRPSPAPLYDGPAPVAPPVSRPTPQPAPTSAPANPPVFVPRPPTQDPPPLPGPAPQWQPPPSSVPDPPPIPRPSPMPAPIAPAPVSLPPPVSAKAPEGGLPPSPIGGCDGRGGKLDECGVCGGDSSSCKGCDGVAGSKKQFDLCGVCGGNSSCIPEQPSVTGTMPVMVLWGVTGLDRSRVDRNNPFAEFKGDVIFDTSFGPSPILQSALCV